MFDGLVRNINNEKQINYLKKGYKDKKLKLNEII